MINIQVRTKFNRIPVITAEIRPTVSQVVRKTAHDIEADVKAEMRDEKHGRTYGTHQASAPGEAPAVDTGLLINSIQVEEVTDLTSSVGTPVEYAATLEFGSSRIAPRPIWVRTVEKAGKPFIAALTFVLSRLK